jgi:hypothetical protein
MSKNQYVEILDSPHPNESLQEQRYDPMPTSSVVNEKKVKSNINKIPEVIAQTIKNPFIALRDNNDMNIEGKYNKQNANKVNLEKQYENIPFLDFPNNSRCSDDVLETDDSSTTGETQFVIQGCLQYLIEKTVALTETI